MTYRVKTYGSHYPIWTVKAASKKEALDRVALATRMPRRSLIIITEPRPRFPEDDE